MKRSKLRIFKKKQVDGIRQGQESDELLGYEFERGLHETSRKRKKRRN
ncbi:MAG: hypothetical protein ACTSP9_02745 [Promethearchaeota archaeon]